MIYQHYTIGIVGLGFVGSAVYNSVRHYSDDLVLVDKDPSRGLHNFEDLFNCQGIFVCVPSPEGEDGSCDTSILEEVLERLKGFTGVIISKTTAPPTVYKRLNDLYPNLVHSPEFLTAANATADYQNGEFAFIGGKVLAYQKLAEEIIKRTQPKIAKVHYCTIEEAALTKYAINCFLATKVIFMNELKQLADSIGVDYNTVSMMMIEDKRIGRSHMKVPGPDGSLGFGGACFPKDTAALAKLAQEAGVSVEVLNAAIKKNLLLRMQEPK